MTLDLDELTHGWDCPPGELRARTVVGRDARELLQLRVDLGVMQMFCDGRPDGQRYHGLPSARDYIEHELRVEGNSLGPDDWKELERELHQINYRRMAFSAVAETALQANDDEAARRYIRAALADITDCLAHLRLLGTRGTKVSSYPSLRPTLVFDQARLATQLRIVEGRFEDAIEKAEAGAEALADLLCELGYDEEQRADDPGLRYLRGMSMQLRREYGITQTLAEQLNAAIEDEDFEAAARLRDELRRRQLDPETSEPSQAD